MMSRSILSLISTVLLQISAAAQAETWQIDPPHAAAQFAARHVGISTVRGAFTKVGGIVRYDPADPGRTSLDVSIDAASVDTRFEMRDNDIRGPNLLYVEKYRKITFRSKSVEPVGASKLKITGDLMIHGVTKQVVLDVDGPTGPVKDPRGNLHLGASGTTKIDRRDFGVNGFAGLVGNDVSITIDVELVNPTAGSR